VGAHHDKVGAAFLGMEAQALGRAASRSQMDVPRDIQTRGPHSVREIAQVLLGLWAASQMPLVMHAGWGRLLDHMKQGHPCRGPLGYSRGHPRGLFRRRRAVQWYEQMLEHWPHLPMNIW
jgi:hypothetical protein